MRHSTSRPGWNDGGQKQLRNNCYNHGSNYRTDRFSQHCGREQARRRGGSDVHLADRARGSRSRDRGRVIDNPAANNRCPAEGHLVALVIAPGIDFQWYRKGRTGRWTHKPGPTLVINVDNSNAIITVACTRSSPPSWS